MNEVIRAEEPLARRETRRSSRWMWFFGILTMMAVPFITVPLWYNMEQQLRAEQLNGALQRWENQGPTDYTLTYKVRREYTPDPVKRVPDTYRVEVRSGKVRSIRGPEGQRSSLQDFPFGSMEDMFGHVSRQLAIDAEADGKKPFVVAAFNKQDGHIVYYRRSVIRTGELLEVEIELSSATSDG